jgi:hypothetical protein
MENTERELNTDQEHVELKKYGLVFHAGTLEVGNAEAEKVSYTPFAALVSRIATVSRFAYDFVQDTVTNVLVTILMFRFDGVVNSFAYRWTMKYQHPVRTIHALKIRLQQK